MPSGTQIRFVFATAEAADGPSVGTIRHWTYLDYLAGDVVDHEAAVWVLWEHLRLPVARVMNFFSLITLPGVRSCSSPGPSVEDVVIPDVFQQGERASLEFVENGSNHRGLVFHRLTGEPLPRGRGTVQIGPSHGVFTDDLFEDTVNREASHVVTCRDALLAPVSVGGVILQPALYHRSDESLVPLIEVRVGLRWGYRDRWRLPSVE